MSLRVAVYGPYNNTLYGTLELGPTGIIPHPAGAPGQREEYLEKLQRLIRNWRLQGQSDEEFLQQLPHFLHGRVVPLAEGQETHPGFDSLKDDPDGSPGWDSEE